MPIKPNECRRCSFYDKWLLICTDDIWVNKHTGEDCCRYHADAVYFETYEGEIIDKNTRS